MNKKIKLILLIPNSKKINIKKFFYSHFDFFLDFFEPIQPITNKSKSPEKNTKAGQNTKNNFKCIYVNIEKEEDEDRELLELLNGKRK